MPGGREAAGLNADMRAAFFESARTMKVRTIPRPEPGPGEVLVRIRYCGLCGSDLSLWEGGALSGPDVVLGHEIVGEVLADPGGRWTAGTRVVVFPPRGCGRCVWCEAGEPRHCLDPPLYLLGGFAQYGVFPAAHLVAVPADVSTQAAALADPLGVALRAIEIAAPRPGDVVYVAGLGPVGLLTAAGLVAAGCTVIGGEPRPERRELGLELGCAVVLDPHRDDPEEAATRLSPFGAQFAFECSGSEDGLQQIFDACGPGGTVAILGIPKAPVLLLRMTVREQRAFSIAGPSRESMAAALDHLERLPQTAAVISDVIPLDQLGPRIDQMVADGAGVKVLVDPHL